MLGILMLVIAPALQYLVPVQMSTVSCISVLVV